MLHDGEGRRKAGAAEGSVSVGRPKRQQNPVQVKVSTVPRPNQIGDPVRARSAAIRPPMLSGPSTVTRSIFIKGLPEFPDSTTRTISMWRASTGGFKCQRNELCIFAEHKSCHPMRSGWVRNELFARRSNLKVTMTREFSRSCSSWRSGRRRRTSRCHSRGLRWRRPQPSFH